ncbi:MAG: tetratricopeptide repeat protein [Myxococcaceae bacterium]
MDLESVLHKLTQGKSLTLDEAQALERAAGLPGAPVRLRVAWAHALMEGERNEDALSLTAQLVKQHATDGGAWLAHARALVGLEHYADAERALQKASGFQPGDPEITKAQALLALRRGEHQRAHAWVSNVLSKDPFDGEARLIREALDAGDAGPATISSEASSNGETARWRALTKALWLVRIPHWRRGDELWLRMPDDSWRRVAWRQLIDVNVPAEGLDAAARVAVEALGTSAAPKPS